MKRILAVAWFAVFGISPLALLTPRGVSPDGQAFAQSCQQNCDGLTSLPPQPQPARSFVDFINFAYQGAYGRSATCFEVQYEHSRLANADATGNRLAEARRFVATLFMTQSSYDAQDLTTYLQTSEYQQRNPQDNNDGAGLSSFIADLYWAFLQREPDAGGQCFWVNNACSEGRKKAIRAFEVSIEFGELVDHLYNSGAPSCGPGPGDGDGPCLHRLRGDFDPICPVN